MHEHFLLYSMREGQIETLEAFTKLRTLKLSRNNINYIGELESCFNLWYLDLSNNMVRLACFFELVFIYRSSSCPVLFCLSNRAKAVYNVPLGCLLFLRCSFIIVAFCVIWYLCFCY